VIGPLLVAAAVGGPALAFVVWPLLRRGRARRFLPLPEDPREQLLEEKRVAYRALRELLFEHDAGHLSDDDYAALRDRYEARAAEVLAALDALVVRPAPAAAPVAAPRSGVPWTRRPVTTAVGAVAVLGFGVTLGLGVAWYGTPDGRAGAPTPPAAPPPDMPTGAAPSLANAPRGRVTPAMLAGMLEAARASLFAGRYSEAIAAYEAVLKRDPRNVDALTHLGLILSIGGHGDVALETFGRALRIDPNYPPALLYRGQVLYEIKRDYAGAARSWDKFLAVVPAGEDRDRVAALARDAHARAGGAGADRPR
jgi:tetratricopeptide (TPR) repeat protein